MKKQGKLRIGARGASDAGQRWNNEDAYLVNEDLGLFIVADGIGGCERGEVASWFTSENLEAIVSRAAYSTRDDGTLDPIDTAQIDSGLLMEYAVMAINKRLYDLNEDTLKKEGLPAPDSTEALVHDSIMKRRKMGTTLVSLLIRDGKGYIAHVGDSRAYRIAAGSIERLTHDHSWVEERIREGVISPEEAKGHKKKNVITRSLGFRQEVEADIDTVTLYPPERFLLCSDGLSNVVKEKDLFAFAMIDDLEEACEQMVDLAKANGGKDNITAVLVDVGRTDAKGAVDWHRDRTHDVDDSTDL